jgi:DNA polymerase-1
MVLSAIEGSVRVGLDLETTGLDPRKDRVRLLSLAADTIEPGETFTYIIDCFAVDPRPLFEALAEVELVIHNASFDLGFLTRLGFVPGRVTDTVLLSRLLDGTRRPRNYHALGACGFRHLGQDLPKDLQASDWHGTLTPEQLAYAARDAAVLRPLAEALEGGIKEVKLEQVASNEMHCLPAVVWLAGSGVAIDAAAWKSLATGAGAEAEGLAAQMDRIAPKPEQPGLMGGGWNWNSPEQVKKVFALLGVHLESTDDDALAACSHPLAALLRQYRSASKLASTYGLEWFQDAVDNGRLFAQWKQLGCITGRMACAEPNLQNLPRDRRYRRCFAAPHGRVLVKADYSQIELRIACKIAGERVMLDAYRRGLDLHELTAQRILGKASISKEERQLAKPVNFGLIYGLGAGSLSRKAKADYGLDLSEKDAARYRDAFFAAYPGIARWHQQIKRGRATEVRTLTGRRVLVDAGGFYGGKANYMVQGTGGDGLKLAMALLWQRREQVPGAFPVLAVHDEIVVECDACQADAVSAWLKQAMLNAIQPMLDPVPVEVDVKAGHTWGGNREEVYP